MWDQQKVIRDEFSVDRIIPTYVGSTVIQGIATSVSANHSHVCGINPTPPGGGGDDDESFPRMWDQHLYATVNGNRERIIPTYVGSTHSSVRSMLRRPNHSHVCGINLRRRDRVNVYSESFPRMWDQLIFCKTERHAGRIIPTYVGSTASDRRKPVFESNHSHVCGINITANRFGPFNSESFPRMWDQLFG